MLVLSDSEVQQLLGGLDIPTIKQHQQCLIQGLLEYYQNNELIPQRIVTRTQYATHLFMASTGSNVGMKALTSSKRGFAGVLTLIDKQYGNTLGVLNAATVTAFRTALATSLALVKAFPNPSDIGGHLICYGIGPQAKWHIHLALLLYPGRFDKVIIVNRTAANAEPLALEIAKLIPMEVRGLDDPQLADDYTNASVIFTCVPSTTPTVVQSLVSRCKRSKLFIGAIGSYQPQMIEIEGAVIKDCLAHGGKIIVDSAPHCLAEAGEFIQNGITRDSLCELASLYGENPPKDQVQYLSTGRVVISKLVGLCIMDVSVGASIVDKAKEAGVGTQIDNF